MVHTSYILIIEVHTAFKSAGILQPPNEKGLWGKGVYMVGAGHA